MFIALRELRFAKGRFAMLGGVIAMMTFLVLMLGGLAAGLGAASVSAVDRLPVDALAFARPAQGQGVSFTTSALPAGAADTLAAQPGVRAAHPLGVATVQLTSGSMADAVSLIGTDPDVFPTQEAGQQPGRGQIALSAGLAQDQHAGVGDQVEVSGQRLTVAEIVADTSFNHLPTAYTTIDTWQQLTHTTTITAVGLRLDGASPATLGVPGVQVVTKHAAFDAVGAYSSEQGSLTLIRGLLIVVSALVVGSFFTVWTMQRSGDLAVVRAIGASRRYLLGDALGQAVIILIAGAAAGAGVTVAAGALAATVVPFLLTITGITLPLAAMVAVGLVGAALSVRRVTTVDPLTALGAVR
jgi:putative ABC transport system permease protein